MMQRENSAITNPSGNPNGFNGHLDDFLLGCGANVVPYKYFIPQVQCAVGSLQRGYVAQSSFPAIYPDNDAGYFDQNATFHGTLVAAKAAHVCNLSTPTPTCTCFYTGSNCVPYDGVPTKFKIENEAAFALFQYNPTINGPPVSGGLGGNSLFDDIWRKRGWYSLFYGQP